MTDEVIERIVEVANSDDGADGLLEMTVSVTDEALYDAAIDAFGTWDAALAHTVEHLLQTRGSSRKRSVQKEEEIIRRASQAARDPLFTTTTAGHFFRVDGAELDITDAPENLETPPGAGAMHRFFHVGDPDGIFVFSDAGRYYGLIPRVVPQWMGPSELRSMHEVLPAMFQDESIVAVLPRRAGRTGRIVHVTMRGKGKASDADEYGRTLDQSGREAFLLNDDDRPVAVLTGTEDDTIFCASALGQGIHFEASDVRSMGRKAVGVNVMKLDGDEDAVVNAFMGGGVEQVAVITAEGLGKRVDFSEFRTQGRGGAGMQLLKQNPNDRVADAVAIDPSDDVVVTTSKGRVHRREAADFELMGRPAKGNRMIDLDAGERVVGLSAAPTSTDNIE